MSVVNESDIPINLDAFPLVKCAGDETGEAIVPDEFDDDETCDFAEEDVIT